MEGNGEFVWTDGKSYNGQWKANKMYVCSPFYSLLLALLIDSVEVIRRLPLKFSNLHQGIFIFDFSVIFWPRLHTLLRDGEGEFKWSDGRTYKG